MNRPAPGSLPDPALVDFGAHPGGPGRRLERLGGILVDRPLPLPVLPAPHDRDWSAARAVFGGDSKGWVIAAPCPTPWQVTIPLGSIPLVLEVRPAPSGQVGVFIEQVGQWAWLTTVVPAGARMLSLFAHSGAATLALAAAGAEVVHVDASKQAMGLARRNAAASGLDAAPIRWVCEDARGFIARERRRGSRYDGVVLDPPSWGHGPRGQAFAIDRDLEPLLADLAAVCPPPRRGPVLLTCHAPRWPADRLRDTLARRLPGLGVESGDLVCHDAAGRPLHLGGFARQPGTG